MLSCICASASCFSNNLCETRQVYTMDTKAVYKNTLYTLYHYTKQCIPCIPSVYKNTLFSSNSHKVNAMDLSETKLSKNGGRVTCQPDEDTNRVANVFNEVVQQELDKFDINEKRTLLKEAFTKVGPLLALTNEQKASRMKADAEEMEMNKDFIFQKVGGLLESDRVMPIIFRKIFVTIAEEHGEEEAKKMIFEEKYIVGAHFPCPDGTLSVYTVVCWMLLFGISPDSISMQSWSHLNTENRIAFASKSEAAWVFSLDIGVTRKENWSQVRGLFVGDHHEGPNQHKIREAIKNAINAGCVVVDFSQYRRECNKLKSILNEK